LSSCASSPKMQEACTWKRRVLAWQYARAHGSRRIVTESVDL
jgi:hypothetical protein